MGEPADPRNASLGLRAAAWPSEMDKAMSGADRGEDRCRTTMSRTTRDRQGSSSRSRRGVINHLAREPRRVPSGSRRARSRRYGVKLADDRGGGHLTRPYLDYPFARRRPRAGRPTAEDDHIRDMIVQVLFTNPGERVNRPDFGCGLRALLFMPNSDALAVATQVLTKGALQRWLEDEIQVDQVEVRRRGRAARRRRVDEADDRRAPRGRVQRACIVVGGLTSVVTHTPTPTAPFRR